MSTAVVVIGVIFPTLLVCLFAYCAYLTEGGERERR
jgi:hypothetical protein